MSYDLCVFDPDAAPRTAREFRDWYEAQTRWGESHGYNDPNVPTPALRAWFHEVIALFPPMNGPLASDDADDPRVTDYSLGRHIIYAAFAWSVEGDAFRAASEAAVRHRVGFYHVSGEVPEVSFPVVDTVREVLRLD